MVHHPLLTLGYQLASTTSYELILNFLKNKDREETLPWPVQGLTLIFVTSEVKKQCIKATGIGSTLQSEAHHLGLCGRQGSGLRLLLWHSTKKNCHDRGELGCSRAGGTGAVLAPTEWSINGTNFRRGNGSGAQKIIKICKNANDTRGMSSSAHP